LSGAIDVIVIEQENGDLACSPFHVRFGKFSLLLPSEKKVPFPPVLPAPPPPKGTPLIAL